MICHPRQAFAKSAVSRIQAGLAVFSAIVMLLASAPALAASAPDAGDFVALPPGTNLALLYAQQVRANAVYDGQRKIADDFGLRLDTGIAHYVHYEQVAGHIAAWELILPFGRQRIAAADSTLQGTGSAIFGGTAWAIADEARGEYLAGAAYVTTPTGSHKTEGFVFASNRWAADMQIVYIHRLSGPWFAELLAQCEAYSPDRTTGIRRDPFWRGFAHLRYAYALFSHVALSVRHGVGARETLGETVLTPSRQETNVALTWAVALGDAAQLQLQYARDVRVRNSVRADIYTARLAYAF